MVAFAVGGIPPMAGEAGLLLPPGDAGAMRAALLRLLGDESLAGDLAAAALARGKTLPGDADAVEAALKNYA